MFLRTKLAGVQSPISATVLVDIGVLVGGLIGLDDALIGNWLEHPTLPTTRTRGHHGLFSRVGMSFMSQGPCHFSMLQLMQTSVRTLK